MKQIFVLISCTCILIISCTTHKSNSILSGKAIKSIKGKTGSNGLSTSVHFSNRIVMPEFSPKLKLPPKEDPSGIAIVDDKVEQHFSIDCKKDTIITCAEGTKIFIPAQAFANEKNKTVNSVNFNVKEYYSKRDIVLAGLTTHADKKMLESGGMVYLTAKNNDSDCHLKKDKDVELSFPTKKSKNGMQVFNGVKKGNTINWVLPNKKAVMFIPPPIIDEIVYEDAPQIMDVAAEVDAVPSAYNVVEQAAPDVYETYNVQEQPEFVGGIDLLKVYMTKNTVYPNACSDGCIQGKVFVEFTVDAVGDITDVRIKRGVHPLLDKEAKRVVAAMPKWKPAKQSGKQVACRYIYPINFKLECESSNVRIPNEDENKTYPNANKTVTRDDYVKEYVEKIEDIHEVEQDQLEYYVMSSAKLGWINCDRFVTGQKTERLAVNETDKKSTTVRMVFTRIKSVLGGSYVNGEFVFTGFPANEPVVIVGFKKVGNKNFMAMQETSSNSKTISLSYKEVSLEQLKIEIGKLNGGSVNLAKN